VGQPTSAGYIICDSAPEILPPTTAREQSEAMKLFPILKNTFACWLDDDAPTLGAALAEYTVFLLAPLLIISIAISGFFREFFFLFDRDVRLVLNVVIW